MSEPRRWDRLAVREVCREALPERIDDVAGYSWALIVYRFRGAAVGKAVVPVRDGTINGNDLRAAVNGGMAWQMWVTEFAGEPEGRPRRATVAVIAGDADDAEASLRSVAAYREQGHEVLMVGGSGTVQPRSPGRAAACNAACAAASNDVIAFLEAPALADAAWLDGLLRGFADPTAAMVLPVPMPLELDTAAQAWLEELYSHARSLAPEAFDITNVEPLTAPWLHHGTGIAVRRSMLREAGGFVDGEPDAALICRLLDLGGRVVREPRAVVWNRLPRDWESARRAAHEYGATHAAWWATTLLRDRNAGSLRVAPAWFLGRCARNLVRSALRRPRSAPLDLALAEVKGAAAGVYSCFAGRDSSHDRGAATFERTGEMTTP